MTDDFSTALMLMAVGMITVFIILALIVTFGNVLIRIVNRYFPEEVLKKTSIATRTSGIDPKKIAAITAVVDVITGGRGKVTGINRKE